jgi:hypothetical protein
MSTAATEAKSPKRAGEPLAADKAKRAKLVHHKYADASIAALMAKAEAFVSSLACLLLPTHATCDWQVKEELAGNDGSHDWFHIDRGALAGLALSMFTHVAWERSAHAGGFARR